MDDNFKKCLKGTIRVEEMINVIWCMWQKKAVAEMIDRTLRRKRHRLSKTIEILIDHYSKILPIRSGLIASNTL